ncbi:hypothetical protein [Buchananella hordeovulneris]|uniref:Tat pathway signal sequence n=1 Tax=Buchananella hordeovulneris TaxID=52770 RepID=A0A1Q5PUB5_9ACTO|nr:hypothetical protein [Buchananella hordeovulneris]OKL51154.1 hypothetical protein BSZ40_08685 [Buchananella hordeovulneris]
MSGQRRQRAATPARWLLALGVAALTVGSLAVGVGWLLPGRGGGQAVDARDAGDGAVALRGVTVEQLIGPDRALSFLEQVPGRETVRVVLEPGRPLADYAPLVRELAAQADVMLQLADSSELAALSEDEVGARARAAVKLFGDHVTIWEVGNEPNGQWAGSDASEIAGKVNVAAQIVRATGGKTAVTFNYWDRPDCYSEDWEDPLAFAPFLDFEPDYVFLSVYETACVPPQHPDAEPLGEVLNQLGARFPRALLGIGEIGAQGAEDGLPEPDTTEKERVARYYHGLDSKLREIVGNRYVGGYFWWYFVRDVLTAEDPRFWEVLRGELANSGASTQDL